MENPVQNFHISWWSYN